MQTLDNIGIRMPIKDSQSPPVRRNHILTNIQAAPDAPAESGMTPPSDNIAWAPPLAPKRSNRRLDA
jgi:hypothetical protein